MLVRDRAYSRVLLITPVGGTNIIFSIFFSRLKSFWNVISLGPRIRATGLVSLLWVVANRKFWSGGECEEG